MFSRMSSNEGTVTLNFRPDPSGKLTVSDKTIAIKPPKTVPAKQASKKNREKLFEILLPDLETFTRWVPLHTVQP